MTARDELLALVDRVKGLTDEDAKTVCGVETRQRDADLLARIVEVMLSEGSGPAVLYEQHDSKIERCFCGVCVSVRRARAIATETP